MFQVRYSQVNPICQIRLTFKLQTKMQYFQNLFWILIITFAMHFITVHVHCFVQYYQITVVHIFHDTCIS